MNLTVIHGGKSKFPPAREQGTAKYPGLVDAERLRAAVFSLRVKRARITVQKILDRLETKSDDHDELRRALDHIGVMYLDDHESKAYGASKLRLVRPENILSDYPRLAEMHPKAHRYLHLA
jgi:hypothetical protein